MESGILDTKGVFLEDITVTIFELCKKANNCPLQSRLKVQSN